MKKLLIAFVAFMVSGLGVAVAQEAAAPSTMPNEPAKMEEVKKVEEVKKEVKAEKKHAKKQMKKAEKKAEEKKMMEEKKVEEVPPAPPVQ